VGVFVARDLGPGLVGECDPGAVIDALDGAELVRHVLVEEYVDGAIFRQEQPIAQ